MGWARMLLMGNVGQQIDIDEIEEDVVRLRGELSAQRRTDRSQDEALRTLRREIADLKVVVGELTRLLVASGTLPAEAIERVARVVDQTSGPV